MEYFVGGTPFEKLLGKPIDQKKLERMIYQEVRKLLSTFDLSKRPLPKLKASTIAAKKRRGLSNPDQPLYGTGDLLESLEVVYTGNEIQIVCNDYIRFQKSEFYRNFLDSKAINRACSRALSKYLEENENV